MRLNYKRIGDFINRVENRNTDLKVTKLLGLSMTKEFRETTSNIVGTDMSVYRVMSKYQFACDFMSPIRVNKLPVVLKLDDEPNLVSPAYPVFEVKDRTQLDPEYLMMWFRRSEFDRYATFKCDGAIRGGYDWTAFCDTLVPILTIAKQKEIVKEYNVIQNRIALNKEFIQKLEETAQAIYKQWFVDFEFPDENGKGYKSAGGEMVFNEELGKEVPKGWEYKSLGEITQISAGGDKPNSFSSNETAQFKIPVYSNSSAHEGLYGYTNRASVSKKSITVSARGAIIGFTVLRTKPFFPIIRLIVVIPKHEYLLNHLYYSIIQFKYNESGSAQGQLTVPEISSFKIITPYSEILKKYQKISNSIINNIEFKKNENLIFDNFNDILLSKLATIEN